MNVARKLTYFASLFCSPSEFLSFQQSYTESMENINIFFLLRNKMFLLPQLSKIGLSSTTLINLMFLVLNSKLSIFVPLIFFPFSLTTSFRNTKAKARKQASKAYFIYCVFIYCMCDGYMCLAMHAVIKGQPARGVSFLTLWIPGIRLTGSGLVVGTLSH